MRESAGVATARTLPDGDTVLAARLKQLGITHKDIAQKAGVATNTFANAVHGKNIAADKADAIAAALGENTAVLFDIQKNMQPLSNKTILEHHRFISVVFAQAEKELLIPYNPAAKATPPKAIAKEANYFDVDDIIPPGERLPDESHKLDKLLHRLLQTLRSSAH